MELRPVICMLSTDDYRIVSQYPSVQEASDDTLTSVDDIRLSLMEGCAINGFVWTRQFVKKVKCQASSARKQLYKKAVIQYDLDSNIVHTFTSVAEATKLTGITNIDKAARGVLRLAGGYKWKYIENN